MLAIVAYGMFTFLIYDALTYQGKAPHGTHRGATSGPQMLPHSGRVGRDAVEKEECVEMYMNVLYW